MNEHIPSTCRIRRAGFTLAEILLAMLVFAIAITTILALLARSVETAQEILTKDEAIGLSSSVENFMTSIPFLEAYQLLPANPAAPPGVLFAYQYRSDPNTGNPVADPDEDYEVVPWASKSTDLPSLNALSPALESRLFKVALRVSPANPAPTGQVLHPDPNTGNPLNYNSAVVVVYAEFYPVPTYDFDPIARGLEPVFSFNFAVRR